MFNLKKICVVMLLMFACTPSVRYSHDAHANKSVQNQTRQTPARQPGRQATPRRDSNLEDKLAQVVASYLGVPYRYGGQSRNGFDCSGFVMQVYLEVYNKKLPRSSSKMWGVGRAIPITVARPGDLVFFRNNGRQIDHVGIYMGNNRFVHASSSRGVVYDNLTDSYYAQRFAGARHVQR